MPSRNLIYIYIRSFRILGAEVKPHFGATKLSFQQGACLDASAVRPIPCPPPVVLCDRGEWYALSFCLDPYALGFRFSKMRQPLHLGAAAPYVQRCLMCGASPNLTSENHDKRWRRTHTGSAHRTPALPLASTRWLGAARKRLVWGAMMGLRTRRTRGTISTISARWRP